MKPYKKMYRKVEARISKQTGSAFCFDGVWVPATQIIFDGDDPYITNYWYLHKLEQMQKSRIVARKTFNVLFAQGTYRILK